MWTGDERVFFYNPTTRLSMWDRPDDLIGRADVDKIIQEPPHKKGMEEGKKLSKSVLIIFLRSLNRICHFMLISKASNVSVSERNVGVYLEMHIVLEFQRAGENADV